jgi:hypothetical protein
MNFILFNISLLFAGFLALFIFSLGLMACLAPIALFAKWGSPPKVVVLPLMGIAAIYQMYFWGLWSAFCVAMTLSYTQKPEVTWDWAYWTAGFMECTSPIGWLAHKERQSSQSPEEARNIQKGTMLYSLIAIVAFGVFAFFPSLMSAPYGRALKALGLGASTPTATGRIQIDEATRRSVEGFFTGYGAAVDANTLGRGMLTSKDPLADFERVRTLFQKSREQLGQCDRQVLNNTYSGWGDIVADKFIPAIDFMLAGSRPRGDRSDLARGDALMAEADAWLRTNWSPLLVRLNERHGFEIK